MVGLSPGTAGMGAKLPFAKCRRKTYFVDSASWDTNKTCYFQNDRTFPEVPFEERGQRLSKTHEFQLVTCKPKKIIIFLGLYAQLLPPVSAHR